MLVPAASKITLFDGSELGGDAGAVWDKTEALDYLFKNSK